MTAATSTRILPLRVRLGPVACPPLPRARRLLGLVAFWCAVIGLAPFRANAADQGAQTHIAPAAVFRGIHHASITISDMQRSLAFYRDLLGLKVTLDERLTGPFISSVMGYPDTDMRVVFLDAGDPSARIELLEMRHPRHPGAAPPLNQVGGTHLALVVDDIKALYRHLTKSGVRCRSTPQEGAAFWALHCPDPDGISVEFVQVKTGRASEASQ